MLCFRVHSPPRRLLMLACMCTAIVFGMANTVNAALLLPGATIPNIPPAVPTIDGKVLDDTGLVPFGFGDPANTGFVRQIVLSGMTDNPFGGVSFIYQVTLNSGDIKRLSGSDYAGFKVDAYGIPAAKGDYTTAKTPGGMAATTPVRGTVSFIDRSLNGSVIGYYLPPSFIIPPGGPLASQMMVAHTDAPDYTKGIIGLIDGGSSPSIEGFAPIPEPASMTLLGIGLAGLGGYAWRRRKADRMEETPSPAV